MVVISDTSPISALFRIGQLELLPKLYKTVVIPASVALELQKLSLFGYQADEIFQYEWLKILQVPASKKLEALREILDPGEAEAIALALELKADTLLIDEVRGRDVALSEGLQIIGVLGILLEAKELGLIKQVKSIIDELVNVAAFRVNPKLYQAILVLANEG